MEDLLLRARIVVGMLPILDAAARNPISLSGPVTEVDQSAPF
jgi:hypothetical protein